MSIGIVNNIQLDYPILKTYTVPYSKTVYFYSGVMFPNNSSLSYAIWNFGDGTTLTTLFSAASARFEKVVDELLNNVDFFPRWTKYDREGVGIVVPKFETSHTYSAIGDYTTSVTLVDTSGVAYYGTPEVVSVKNTQNPYYMPPNWSAISEQYTYNDSAELQYNNGFPRVSSITHSISALPIPVDFTISNLVGRVDVDYILWNFGDDTSFVKEILGAPFLPYYGNVSYNYEMLSNELSYKPSVLIFVNTAKGKFKFNIPVTEVVLQDRTNIGVSYNYTNNPSINNSFAFNIEPVNAERLPVATRFEQKVTKTLKYIIWDYNDGALQSVPVTYFNSLSNINQVAHTTHEYNSVNFYKYLPKCLYLYEDTFGAWTTERYQLRNYLNYDLSLINPTSDYFSIPVISTTNYKKFDNISTLVVYPDTNSGSASVRLRISLDLPQDILFFEKIIWRINGEKIVQDKNTSEIFGQLTINNVVTPYPDYSVTAEVWGIPAIFADEPTSTELVFYDSYSYTFNILDKDVQEAINTANIERFTAAPTISGSLLVSTPTGIEIITPVLSANTEVVTVGETIYRGGNYIFDKLFTADNPAYNYLNRDYPTTASTPTHNLASKRVIGYFRPSKSSIVVVDPGKFTFSINLDNISFYTPYYFPDPYKYGSDTGVLDFYTIPSTFKCGIGFSKARNTPNTTNESVSYAGYTSKTNTDLSYLYDAGYIDDFKSDVYGNKYGLVKANNFTRGVVSESLPELYSVIINGHKFFDDTFSEGYSFNYYLSGSSGETIRTGLSSYTNGFTRPAGAWLLNFRNFKPYDELKAPSEPIDISTQYLNPQYVGFRDCAYFMMSDTQRMVDPVPSDLSAFPGTDSYYFSELYEAGVHTANAYVRPLSDTYYPTITANFTENVRVSSNVLNVDCGMFCTNIVLDNITYTDYISSVNPTEATLYSSVTANKQFLIDRDKLAGFIYIKDTNNSVSEFTNALGYVGDKYGSSVLSQLSGGIVSFDLVYDTYFIQTSSILVIDKIKTVDGAFKSPKTPNIIINHNQTPYNAMSNRFKVDNCVYFSVLSSYGSDNTLLVYPIIYKFDYNNFVLTELFPSGADITQYTDEFGINNGTSYTEATSPCITYMSEADTFNISYILKDQNKSPYLMSIDWEDKGGVSLKSLKGFKFADTNTTLFTNLTNTFVSIVSSGSPTYGADYIIL